MKKAVIYARHSTDKQESSCSDQIERCEKFCKVKQYAVCGIFFDEAVSGAMPLHNRKGISDLVNFLAAGKVDLIIAEDLSRLSRDQGDIAHFFKNITFLQSSIETIEEGPVSTLHIGLKGTMNAMHLTQISDKTRRGTIASVQRGNIHGGKTYGYRTVKKIENGELVSGLREIDEDEAKAVKRIFEMFLAGEKLKDICDDLNQKGIPSPRGKKWQSSALTGTYERHTGILRNSMYMGEMTYNKMHYVKHPTTGKKVSRMNPPEEWIRIPVPDLAIISREDFETVQKRLDLIIVARKPSHPKIIPKDPEVNSGRTFSFARYITTGVPKSLLGCNRIICSRTNLPARREGMRRVMWRAMWVFLVATSWCQSRPSPVSMN